MTTTTTGVLTIHARRALVCFADARASRLGANEHELADAARLCVEGELGHSVPALYALQQHGGLTFLYSGRKAAAGASHCVGACDGLLTGESGVALVVRNADCLPVALAGPKAVAMLHAGWRGLAADILAKAVRRLENELGASPGEMEALVGPGVGPCHYQVGPEVVEALGRVVAVDSEWVEEGRVDLGRFARARLLALGIPAVRLLGPCTACSSLHYSYRRDRTEAGRMWSAIVLVPA